MKCKLMARISDGADGIMTVEYSGIMHYVKSSATRELKKAQIVEKNNPIIIDFFIEERD